MKYRNNTVWIPCLYGIFYVLPVLSNIVILNLSIFTVILIYYRYYYIIYYIYYKIKV